MSTTATFAGGRNTAMKVPPHLWDATVQSYRDVVGLKVIEQAPTVPRGTSRGATRRTINHDGR